MTSADVLVLGDADAGKTHYAGQLLGRFRHKREGQLRLQPGGVDDLGKLEEVLSCLEEGRAAGHTAGSTWTGIRCSLETRDGRRVVLEWPEYAGERLFPIVEQRSIPRNWVSAVQSANAWLLLIRPSTLTRFEDLLNRPIDIERVESKKDREPTGPSGWDDQARYVELLQMLLFATRKSRFHQAAKPRLAIVLSCWDENQEKRTPEDAFAQNLPLVHAFIDATWGKKSWSVWGLSALGRKLAHDRIDEEYAAKGPENFGYVVRPDTAEESPDLTEPVAWLLED